MHVLDGTIRCCLCKGFVSTSNSDRFTSHMNNEHNTFFNNENGAGKGLGGGERFAKIKGQDVALDDLMLTDATIV